MASQGEPVAIWDRDDLFEELDALDAATEGVSVSELIIAHRAHDTTPPPSSSVWHAENATLPTSTTHCAAAPTAALAM